MASPGSNIKSGGAIKVVMRLVSELAHYSGNAKSHPPAQIAHIKASIKRFGFVNPILIDADDVMIAGHGRLEAAVELGLARVPTIMLSHLSPEEVKALRIADNSIPEGGIWNPDLLEAELASLRAVDFDLESLGLDNIKLEEIEEPVVAPPKANRSKTTIFLAVKNEDVARARKVTAAALDKAKITHNL